MFAGRRRCHDPLVGMPGNISLRCRAAAVECNAPAPAEISQVPGAEAACLDAQTALSTVNGTVPSPLLERKFSGFVSESVVGLQCCCSIGSIRNTDGHWTELLLLAIDAHGDFTRDELGCIEDDSVVYGGLQVGTIHYGSEFLHDHPRSHSFRPLLLSDDRMLCPADLQCHAVDEAGVLCFPEDRYFSVKSMCVLMWSTHMQTAAAFCLAASPSSCCCRCCFKPLSIKWSLRDAEEVEVSVAIGRSSGMVQFLHIPLICDHDSCSVSISTCARIRIINPYIKRAELQILGPVAHTSASVSSDVQSQTCIAASHGPSCQFSLWQLPHDPCASYSRCCLCPCISLQSEAVASFCYRRSDHSVCFVIARTSLIEIWLYPPDALQHETPAGALQGQQVKRQHGVMLASLRTSPQSVTAMAALQFHDESSGEAQMQRDAATSPACVSFIIGHSDGSLRQLHVDVWASNVAESVSCHLLPPFRCTTEQFSVKYIQPWHDGSCLFVCAWADGCVQAFGSLGGGGAAYPLSAMHRLSPGCSLTSMSISDGAMILITCSNSLIFADLTELLDFAQFSNDD